MANEKRLIDAELLVPIIEAEITDSRADILNRTLRAVLDLINGFPTVDAVEVVHGHWTSTGIFSKRAGYGVRYYQHAECEVAPCRLFECEHDYCPNCGAKMDGGNEDGK